jgi:hypothetical protein
MNALTKENIMNNAENIMDSAKNAMNSAKDVLTNTINDFSSPKMVETTDKSFLDSNGIIAKVVFLILVVIIYIILFYIVVYLISYFIAVPSNPFLINGQVQGTTLISIPQNPSDTTSKTIIRSNNRPSGIEFTWVVWLNYKDSIYNDKYSPVFVKGDISTPELSYCSINNCPGVYFGKKTDTSPNGPNTLHILIDTPSSPAINNNTNSPIIKIENLPTDTYFHLAIRCQNTYIDIYINGTLVKRQNLMNVPKQNFYNVNVCPSGGFNGTLSNLQYFDKALTVVEINTIVQNGPNQKDIKSNNPFSAIIPNTISTSWYNSFLH